MLLFASAALAKDPPQPVPLAADPATARPVALVEVGLAPRPLLLELSAPDLRARIEGAFGTAGYRSDPQGLRLSARLDAASCKGALRRGCEVAITWDLADAHGATWTGLTRGAAWVEQKGAERAALEVALDRAITSVLADRSFADAVHARVQRTWRADEALAFRCDAPTADVAAAVPTVEGASGAAAGVILSSDGQVATTTAVVGDAAAVRVDGSSAQVVRREGDLALVGLAGQGWPCLAIGAATEGAPVRAVGLAPPPPPAVEGAPPPAPAAPEVREGTVTAIEPGGVLRTSITLDDRFAGGALVDAGGAVVGLLDARLEAVTPQRAFAAAVAPAPVYRARPEPSWLLARPTAGEIRGHYVLGATGALLGSVATILGTQSVYQGLQTEGASVLGWRALQLANGAGWLLGAGSIGLGVRAATIRERDPIAADSAEFSP